MRLVKFKDEKYGEVQVNPKGVAALLPTAGGQVTIQRTCGAAGWTVSGTVEEVAAKLQDLSLLDPAELSRSTEARRLVVMQTLAAVEEWFKAETPQGIPMERLMKLFSHVKRKMEVDW